MKLLVVIDMQNDFIDGSLGTREAVQIVANVKDKIRNSLKNGGHIVYTRDTHTDSYLHTQEGHRLPIIHCVKSTSGWDIANGLYVEGCHVVDKPSFGSLELAEYVAQLQDVEEIELIGLCTDICVISNAMILKARLPEIPISVDASCCAGTTPQGHQNALSAMKMCQIVIKNSEK